jgi:site-specific DNA recombinase
VALHAYARLSENPDGTRTGVARQLDDLYTAAEAEGVAREQVTVHTEDDRSAWSEKPRPQFERLLRELGADDTVWFWKLDRGFRRGDDWQRFLTVTNARNIHWRSLRDGLDTRAGDRDTIELLGTILVWQAQKESRNTSIRQRSKQRELALAGKPSGGGSRPFGLTSNWSATVPAEAKLIRQGARFLIAGGSLYALAKRWNDAGVATAAGARRWTPTVLKTLFTSYRLAGYREWEGALYNGGAIPTILDLEMVERLRAKLGGRSRPQAATYLLSGLLRCGECGSRLHAKAEYVRGQLADGGRQRRLKFWCPGSAAGSGCGRVSIVYDPVERLVVGALLQALEHPELAAAMRGDETDWDAIRAELAATRDRLAELAVDRYAKEMRDFEYNAARGALLAEEERLQGQLATTPLEEVRQQVGPDAVDWWNQADAGARRALVEQFIERVVVHRAKRLGRRFDPQRLELIWAF